MADRMELLAEGHRRGILTPELEAEYQKGVQSGSIPPANSTKAGNTNFDNTSTLRKDFESRPAVQNYLTILPQIATAMQLAKRGTGKGADDLNIIYTFGKVMDPGSVVREGELAMAADTGSLSQAAQGWISKIQSGQRLPDELRLQLVESMRQRGVQMKKAYDQTRDSFKGIAERAGINPLDVVGPSAGAPYVQAEADFTGKPVYDRGGQSPVFPTGYKAPLPALGNSASNGGGDTPFASSAVVDAINARGVTAAAPGDFEINGRTKTVPRPGGQENYEAVSKMMRDGTPDADILAYVGKMGITPEEFQPALDLRRTKGITNFAPGEGWLTMEVPLTQAEVQRNLDETQPGTVFAKNFSNDLLAGAPRAVATSGLLDPTGEREAAINAADKAHPNYATAGKVLGTLAGSAGAEGIAGKALLGMGVKGAAKIGAPLGDTLFAATGGAIANPDAPVTGAIENGLLALGGGTVARGGGSSIVSPKGGKFGEFAEDGIRPTPGQRLADAGDPDTFVGGLKRAIGTAVNATEQAAGSIPLAGAAFRGARAEGMSSWERVGFNRALKAIGEEPLPKSIPVGPQAMKYVGEKMDATYDAARSGMTFVPDKAFAEELGQWQAKYKGGVLNKSGEDQVNSIISNMVGSRLAKGGGVLTGDTYKLATSDLSDAIASISQPEVKAALKDFNDIFKAGAYRASDPEAAALMDKADKGWSMFKPLRSASEMAGSEPGRFTPTGLSAVERRTQGKSRAYVEGQTLLNKYVNRGMAMRNTLGDTGSMDRAAVVAPSLLADIVKSPAIPLAAPYLPGVRKLVSNALMPSPREAAYAEFIRRRGGPLGVAAIATPYGNQPQPDNPLAGAYR
jgi:hypothetical protein